MIEPCWYELKIDCSNALKKTWQLPDTQGKDFGVWAEKADDMFDPEWLKIMKDHGLKVSDALIFYRDPHHNTYNAHIDIHRLHPKKISTFGLNWCIGGEDSIMTWYKLPKITTKPTPGGAGTIYHNWPINELEELDRGTVTTNLTLVRVGIPHAVIMKDAPRWAISARGAVIDETMYWKDITQWFRDKELLIERQPDVQKDPV